MSLTLIHSSDTQASQRPTSDATKLANEVESMVFDAYAAGRAHGERQHYMAGWRWGLICGLLAGLLSGGAAVALYFHYH